MADQVNKASCSWSYTTADVTTQGNNVTVTRQGNLRQAALGAPFTVADTFDRSNPNTFQRQRRAFGFDVGSPTTVQIARSEDARIMLNRCANDLSRANNPMWRAVRDVANMF